VFPARSSSTDVALPDTSACHVGSNPSANAVDLGETHPENGVRQPSSLCSAAVLAKDPKSASAHPSNPVVAQLNANWRVVDDRQQWRLQRKKGNSRKRNFGWKDRSFCRTREGLLRRIREYCGEVEPAALSKLNALPARRELQNLDVRGTDRAHADAHEKAPVSEGLEVTGTGQHPPRRGQSASS